MKKKLLAIFLTVAMIVALLPTIALAADGKILFSLTPGMVGATFTCTIGGTPIETSVKIDEPEQEGHSFNLNDEVVIVVTGKDVETNYCIEKSQMGIEESPQSIYPTSKEGQISTFNVTMTEAGEYRFTLNQKMGGGEHGGEEKQTSITGIVLDPITLNKEYDGYYITPDASGYADPNSFRYVVNTQTIKMTLSYMKEGLSKPDSKYGTYEDIKKQVQGLPMQFSLKDPGSDNEKYLNSDVKTGDKLSLMYATVSGRPPQENDYRLIDNENNSVEITIKDGDSKLTAVKRFLDNITSTGKLYINSVKFTDNNDIKAAVDAYLDSLDNKPTGVIFETTVTNGKVTITAKQDAFGNYPKLYDVKDIEVTFSGPLNDKAVSQVDKAIKKIKTVQSIHPDKKYNVYQENFYTVEDLDLFNYYESTRNSMIGGTDRLANMINFSREFREDVLDNTNIKAYLTVRADFRPEDGASSDGLYIGKLVLAYDGCVYAIVDNVGVASARVFYISSKIDSTSYLAYAQEIENRLAKHKFNRIIEPGSPEETAISYLNMRKQQHAQNPNETPETIAPITDIKGKETEDKLTTAENKYYIMDHAVRYNIVIDDTKAEYYSNLAVESIDVETKASVKVDITAVPLDMYLKVEKLKKGDDAHDANMKKFDLEEGITYDFELSSTATGSSITKAVYMDKNQKEQYDVFTVTMPVTKEYYDKFKAGAEVMAYNDKDTKGHPVTDIVKKGDQYLAIFETTHFSAYTIAAGAVNPKTGNQDNAMLWIFVALGALILTSGVFAFTRKKSNR